MLVPRDFSVGAHSQPKLGARCPGWPRCHMYPPVRGSGPGHSATSSPGLFLICSGPGAFAGVVAHPPAFLPAATAGPSLSPPSAALASDAQLPPSAVVLPGRKGLSAFPIPPPP